MPPADPDLSAETRRLLAEVAAHLQRDHREALRGICATVETRKVKHGRFGPAGSVEQAEHRMAEAESETDDLLVAIQSDAYHRSELPPEAAGQTRVSAVRRTPAEAGGVPGFVLTLQQDPPRLLRADAVASPFPGIARLAMAPLAMSMAFEYVGGVPVVSEMRMRVRSRGLGRFRFDYEAVSSAAYRPCA